MTIPFNPIPKMTDMGKKKYLMVTYRLIWFHQEKPEWAIESDLHELGGIFYVKAVIRDEAGRIRATGLATMRSAGKAEKAWEGREIEKCETAAIGRALERCGYSTGSAILQFANRGKPDDEMPDFVNDDDEGDHLSSAPIEDTPPVNVDTTTGEVTNGKPDDVSETRQNLAQRKTRIPPKYKAFKVLETIGEFNPVPDGWGPHWFNQIVEKMTGPLALQDTDSDNQASAKIMMYLATESATHGWLLTMDKIREILAVQLGKREPDARASLDEWLKAKRTLQQAWKALADHVELARLMAQDAADTPELPEAAGQ